MRLSSTQHIGMRHSYAGQVCDMNAGKELRTTYNLLTLSYCIVLMKGGLTWNSIKYTNLKIRFQSFWSPKVVSPQWTGLLPFHSLVTMQLLPLMNIKPYLYRSCKQFSKLIWIDKRQNRTRFKCNLTTLPCVYMQAYRAERLWHRDMFDWTGLLLGCPFTIVAKQCRDRTH